VSDPKTGTTDRFQREQSKLIELGINREYISLLVDAFYTQIRSDPGIAPVFDAAIQDEWETHLANMKRFWNSVILHEAGYIGNPTQTHKAIPLTEPRHFHLWLVLFKKTLTETAPTPGAIDYFMERAERIARHLHKAMFGSELTSGGVAPSETT
jgi:hemoglobin